MTERITCKQCTMGFDVCKPEGPSKSDYGTEFDGTLVCPECNRPFWERAPGGKPIRVGIWPEHRERWA